VASDFAKATPDKKAHRHKGRTLNAEVRISDNFVPSAYVPLSLPSLTQSECLGAIASAYRGVPLDQDGIQSALASAVFPDGTVRPVFDLVNPGESVCLVVSDHTRKTAADLILPVLLKGLSARGCSLKDMFILFASGIHRHPTTAEVERILGKDTAGEFAGRIYLHDADNQRELVSVGKIRNGHDKTWPSTAREKKLYSMVEGRALSRPQDLCNQFEHEVFLNRKAVAADRLVLIGAASFHYHAGFGGGRKSIVPGIAGRATIAFTHGLTIDPVVDRLRPGVEIGALDGNPVSEAMFASARLCPPDFIVNTVLAPDGNLAGVFAGEMDLAHRAACRLAEKISRVDISRQADFVIASAGSASNWIQSHKAFYNAHRAVHEKGLVILEAKCPEGIGNERFRYWVKMRSASEIFDGLRQAPEVNGQTALSTRARAPRTVLVTQMSKADLADLGIRAVDALAGAIKIVMDDLSAAGIKKPCYYTMPDAMGVVPFLRK